MRGGRRVLANMIKEGFSENLAFELRYEECERSGRWIFWEGRKERSKQKEKASTQLLRWE